MAFVYEEVGEENRELWESIGWKNCWKDSLEFFSGRMWSIDKVRNLYMQPIGGYIDMPNYCDLAYKGRIVRMEVIEVGDETIDIDGFNFSWKVTRIYIPKSLWEEKKKVLLVIEEALLVNRARQPKDRVNSISVKIDCEPECVEVDYKGR